MIQLPEEGNGAWGRGKAEAELGTIVQLTLVLIKITLIRISFVNEIYQGKTSFFQVMFPC